MDTPSNQTVTACVHEMADVLIQQHKIPFEYAHQVLVSVMITLARAVSEDEVEVPIVFNVLSDGVINQIKQAKKQRLKAKRRYESQPLPLNL